MKRRMKGGVKKSKADIPQCRPTGACSPCNWKDTLTEVVAMKVRVGGSIILVEGVRVGMVVNLPWEEGAVVNLPWEVVALNLPWEVMVALNLPREEAVNLPWEEGVVVNLL